MALYSTETQSIHTYIPYIEITCVPQYRGEFRYSSEEGYLF